MSSSQNTATLTSIRHVTHNVVHLKMTRPEGFDFHRGQAVPMGIDRGGYREPSHPFTMVTGPEDDHLEFVIKCYPTDQHPDHDGMTERIEKLTPGTKIFLGEPEGTIGDEGEGVFIAGGAGITPFISILEARARRNALHGSTLVFSNKTEKDIILRDRWDEMAGRGLQVRYTLTEEDNHDFPQARITTDYLRDLLGELPNRRFYVCGPPPMMEAVIADLRRAQVPDHRLIAEDWWLEG